MWWSNHQAKRLWLRQHGGYLWTTLGLAILFGALTGSFALLVLLVAVSLVLTAYARSRPWRTRRNRYAAPPLT